MLFLPSAQSLRLRAAARVRHVLDPDETLIHQADQSNSGGTLP